MALPVHVSSCPVLMPRAACALQVYGLLAVMMVELFQAWQVVQHAGRQLAKISFIILISLGIGTFPYVDNWSHIGGFAFGASDLE